MDGGLVVGRAGEQRRKLGACDRGDEFQPDGSEREGRRGRPAPRAGAGRAEPSGTVRKPEVVEVVKNPSVARGELCSWALQDGSISDGEREEEKTVVKSGVEVDRVGCGVPGLDRTAGWRSVGFQLRLRDSSQSQFVETVDGFHAKRWGSGRQVEEREDTSDASHRGHGAAALGKWPEEARSVWRE